MNDLFLRPIFTLFCLAFLLVGFAPPAAAQDSGGVLQPDPARQNITTGGAPDLLFKEDESNKEPDIFTIIQNLPPDIADSLLAEAAESQGHCERDVFHSTYYDCSCFGLTYLKARYYKPEQNSMSNIILNMDLKKCVFQPPIAGHHYSRCQIFLHGPYNDEQREKICQCVGSGVARDYAKNPVPYLNYTTRLFRLNMNSCKKSIEARG